MTAAALICPNPDCPHDVVVSHSDLVFGWGGPNSDVCLSCNTPLVREVDDRHREPPPEGP